MDVELIRMELVSTDDRDVTFFEKLKTKKEIRKKMKFIDYRNSQNDRIDCRSRELRTYCIISFSLSIFSIIRPSAK